MDAVPTLIQNMQKNASTKSGEKSLAKALSDHAKDDTGNISDFLKNADLEDGAKILGHILGENKNVLESGVAKKSGLSSDQVSTILSAAAPLLLNVLGQKKEERKPVRRALTFSPRLCLTTGKEATTAGRVLVRTGSMLAAAAGRIQQRRRPGHSRFIIGR